MLFVQDSQGVLLPGGSGLLPNGQHGVAQSPHVLIQSLSMREALGVATSTNKKEVEVLPHMAEGVSEFSLITPQYGQKASCLCLPPMIIDCLTRHSCQWKFVKRNSLSMPMHISGGTTAVKLGGPVFTKVDRATRRCIHRPSRVYKGTQSAAAVNWLGLCSPRRPCSQRMGNQWSTTTSGGSGSDAAAQGKKCSEVSMSSLEGMAPVSNPRRLPLTNWTQLWSIAKVSYLFGRRSSSFTPVGRAASHRGMLFSSSLVVRFLEGDECGLRSSRCHFQLLTHSLLGVEEP